MIEYAAILAAVVGTFSDLPSVDRAVAYQPPQPSKVRTVEGVPKFEFGPRTTPVVRLDALPKHVVDAFLAAEDQRFFEHGGFDQKAIARAMIANVRRVGNNRRLLGASTISQQTSKLLFTDRARTLRRKVREAVMTLRMEAALSKQEILEIYFNEVYFGRGARGLAAASEAYFAKPIAELSVVEAAFLATLPKAPSALASSKNREKALRRRNWVLDRMAATGAINRLQALLAKREELAFAESYVRDQRPAPTEYLNNAVEKQMDDLFDPWVLRTGGLTVTSTLDDDWQVYATRALRTGLERYDRVQGWRGPLFRVNTAKRGWRFEFLRRAPNPPLPHWRTAVVTSIRGESAEIELVDGGFSVIDFDRQALLARAASKPVVGDVLFVRRFGEQVGPERETALTWLDRAEQITRFESDPKRSEDDERARVELIQLPKVNGSLIAIDQRSGHVRAVAGGYAYELSEFNRATQAQRQPGSTIKPLIYLSAVRQGASPQDTVLDAPIAIPVKGQPSWRPRNYDGRFKGPMPLSTALAQSRNVPAVRTARKVGLGALSDTAKLLGAYDKRLRNLPAALGAQETTLMKMTAAYATIGNGGGLIAPSFIDRVTDRDGKVLFDAYEQACAVCRADSRYKRLTSSFYRDGNEAVDAEHLQAVRTMMQAVVTSGTARGISKRIPEGSGGKTGTTNAFRDAWYIGFSDDIAVGVHVGFDQPASLGGGWTGGRLAAPIYADFIEQSLYGKPIQGGWEGYLAALPPKPRGKPNMDKLTRELAYAEEVEFFLRPVEQPFGDDGPEVDLWALAQRAATPKPTPGGAATQEVLLSQAETNN